MKPLRIFYASDNAATPLPFASNVWRNNLLLPLIDLGHDVIEFKYDLRDTFRNLDPAVASQRNFIESNRPKVTRELLRQIREAHTARRIDLFFSYFTDACVNADAIDEIKSLGIKTINWYCNASNHFELIVNLAPKYDYCLVPEKFKIEEYRRIGANPIYCQEAANPNIYKPYELRSQYDVTFVGQCYGDRPLFIEQLLRHGIDTRVWGPGWRRDHRPWHRRLKAFVRSILAPGRGARSEIPFIPQRCCGLPLSDKALVQMYSRSRISLGFTAVGVMHTGAAPVKQVRLRDFEAPMSGAFYLVERFEELCQFFEPDKEIVCFDSTDELVDKARYYLRNPAEREQIRQNGMRRARSEHTWHRRFQGVFEQIGLQ